MLWRPGRLRPSWWSGRRKRSPGGRLGQSIEQDHAQQRPVNLDAPAVFDKPSVRKRFIKKLTPERVVPIISARVSWVILGTYCPGWPGFAKFRHKQEYPRKALFAGVEKADRPDRPECACFAQVGTSKRVLKNYAPHATHGSS